jgi:hypothetical protein
MKYLIFISRVFAYISMLIHSRKSRTDSHGKTTGLLKNGNCSGQWAGELRRLLKTTKGTQGKIDRNLFMVNQTSLPNNVNHQKTG